MRGGRAPGGHGSERAAAERKGPDRKGSDRKGSDRKGPERKGPERKGPERKGPGMGAKAPFHGAGKASFHKSAKAPFRGAQPTSTKAPVAKGPIDRGPRPSRPERDNRPPRPERDNRPPRPERDSRPPRPERESRPPRPEHDSQQPRIHDSAGDAKSGAPRRDGPSREEIWIYGYHPAAAALANPQRKILRIIATPEAADRLRQDASVPADITARLRVMARRDIDQLVGADAVHQGIAVLVRPLDHHLQDILAGLEGRTDACLVLLDQVTDPHNVGAVLRSAAAFGASAVIAPDRHAPDESGVMAKSASGALDKLPYVKTVNLVRAIEIIKEFQFWLVGLDGEAPTALSTIDLSGRIALVLGAEGEGIRRLVADACDHRAKLPISSAMESLNVSNAAAVALYEKARQGAGPKKPRT